MLQLNNLTPSGKKRKRIGRGGSRGGTSGKGHKGQSARSGGSVKAGFEGGQMPLIRRLPKRGFTNARFKTVYNVIGLDGLEKLFADGATVTKEALVEKGVLKKRDKVYKVLGDGKLTKKLEVRAHAFSAVARQAIEKAGGTAVAVQGDVE